MAFVPRGFADSFVFKNIKTRQELDVTTMNRMFHEISQELQDFKKQNKFELIIKYLDKIEEKTFHITRIRQNGEVNRERISKPEFFVIISELYLEFLMFNDMLNRISFQNQNVKMDAHSIGVKFLKLAVEPPLLS